MGGAAARERRVKAAIYMGPNRVVPGEWPAPSAGPGELLLRLRSCGLCGSDIAKIGADHPAPAVFGHEVVGDVLEVGAGVDGFVVGDRVVAAHHVPCFECHYCRRGSPSMCRAFKRTNLDPGGFAELIRVPAPNARWATFRVPPHVSDAAASFVEPLACCLRAVQRSPLATGDVAVVVGLGSIGCLFAQLLRRAGAQVVGTDPMAERVDLAKRLGVEAVADPEAAERHARELSEGRGADVVIVTAGGAAVLPWVAATARDGGTIHYFAGGAGTELPLPLDRLYHRELTVIATYSSSPRQLAEAHRMIVGGEVVVEPLVTHRVPLTEVARGVDLMLRRQAVKVLVVGCSA
jgi:L-iditol 2-dehydrogenase